MNSPQKKKKSLDSTNIHNLSSLNNDSNYKISNNNLKDNKSSSVNRNSKSKSPNKKHKRDKSDVSKFKNNTKKVTWKKPFFEIMDVPSYKTYNLANTHLEPMSCESSKVKCNCIIF